MKGLKRFGQIISTLLSFILAIILTASLTMISAARSINENTIQNAMTSVLQNDEVREEISKEISAVAMSAITDFIKQNAQNSEEADAKIQSWEAAAPGYIDDILSTPEVQDLIGNIASEYAMAAMSNQAPPDISFSSKLNDLVSENGDMVDEKFNHIFTDQNLSEEQAREKIAAYAAEQNIPISENYDSYSVVISEIIMGSGSKIDNSAQDFFGQILPGTAETSPASGSISYQTARFPSPMLAIHFSILGLEVNFNEDQTPFEIFTQILAILQNPLIYVLLVMLFAVFFLLFIIFTFSFKKPLLFTGVASVITGLLLIVISKYPIPFDRILTRFSTENPMLDAAIAEALPSVWTSVSSTLTVHAIIAIAISAFFFLLYLIRSFKRKKA